MNALGGIAMLGGLIWLLKTRGASRWFATKDNLTAARTLPGGVRLRLQLSPGPWDRGQYRSSYAGKPFRARGVVLHWPGNSYGKLATLNAAMERDLSVHFTVGLGADGVPEVWQWVPVDVASWHGTTANQFTIGWEIAQPHSDAERAARWGFAVERIPGTDYLTLDRRLVEANVTLIRCLSRQLGFPIKTRRWRDLHRGHVGSPPPNPQNTTWGRLPIEDWFDQGVTVLCHGDFQVNRADPWEWYPQIACGLR